MSCAMAKEMKNESRLSCTTPFSAARSLPIDGKAGRYMSIAKGPMADRRPRTIALRANRDVMKWLLDWQDGAEISGAGTISIPIGQTYVQRNISQRGGGRTAASITRI